MIVVWLHQSLEVLKLLSKVYLHKKFVWVDSWAVEISPQHCKML